MKKTIIILIFILLTITAEALSGTIEIITFEYPPLINAKCTGILQRIINEAVGSMGNEAVFFVRPRKRAMKIFKKTDAGLFLGESRYFPDMLSDLNVREIMYSRIVLVYLKKKYKSFVLTDINELKGSIIGAHLGSNWSPIFRKAGWKIEETANLESNLKKFRLFGILRGSKIWLSV